MRVLGYEDVMGTHGLGDMNTNGERFADLCAEHELVIGGSVFLHKKVHKATWVSPYYTTENQIDHRYISWKFRRTLLAAGRETDEGSRRELRSSSLGG